MMLRNALWLVRTSAFLLLSACSDSALGPFPADAGADASEQSSSGAATSSSSGGAADAGASADAASDADAGPLADSRIDPIEVGRSWTYDVSQLGFYAACPSGSHVSRVTGARELEGKTALTVESLCEGLGPYDYAVEGDRVFSYDELASEWIVALDAPVEAGHAWSDGTRDFVWESSGTVTVPAGTFSECWSATEQVDYTSFTIFCRGVGPVHWHYEDGFGNGYDAKLTATVR